MKRAPRRRSASTASATTALLAAVLLVGAGCTSITPRERVLPAAPTDVAGFSHDAFDGVLGRFVDDRGRVDYAALARDRGDLDAYHARIAAVSPDTHAALFPTADDRLAYWINAYNASAIVTVLHHYPIESVKDVRSGALFFLPRLAGFFFLQRIELGGSKTNLYDLENRLVRKRFDDPRVHFALNCASISCPRLPRHAFRGDALDAQLEAETRLFVSEARNVRIDPDAGVITLSSIFDWYEGDFTDWMEAHRPDAEPTLVAWITPYLTPAQAAALARCGECEVAFAPYDWGLNDQRAPGSG